MMRGHPGLNRGPLDLQSNALPLSYIPNTIQFTQTVPIQTIQFRISVDLGLSTHS